MRNDEPVGNMDSFIDPFNEWVDWVDWLDFTDIWEFWLKDGNEILEAEPCGNFLYNKSMKGGHQYNSILSSLT